MGSSYLAGSSYPQDFSNKLTLLLFDMYIVYSVRSPLKLRVNHFMSDLFSKACKLFPHHLLHYFLFPVPLLFLCMVICPTGMFSQESNPTAIKTMIDRFKNETRGPYKDIRWFCKDGTVREARDPCPTELGNQRASYRPEVIALADKQHIFLGQILASTPKEEFWDSENAQSRLKQYQLEKYLRNKDDGWVNRKAQYYRGAMQDEDESEWGIEFYKWLLADADNLRSHYFLIRQSVKDIPHADENNTVQLVRALSEDIAEIFPSFQSLRVKIHGNPDAGDSGRVWDFQDENKDKINETMARKFDQLV